MKLITMNVKTQTPYNSQKIKRVGSQAAYDHLISLSKKYYIQGDCLVLQLPKAGQHFHDIKVKGLKEQGVIIKSSRCNALIHYLSEEIKKELEFYGLKKINTLMLEYTK